MTKDELVTKFVEMNERNIQAFDGLKEAINKINDTNALHNAQTTETANHIERLVVGVEGYSKMINKILWVLVIALVVLAGAEKVLKFM